MYMMIAIIKNNEHEKGFRIFDYDSKEVRDFRETDLLASIENCKIIIENLGINEDNKIVGTQGSLDRYSVIGNIAEVRYKYPIVILNKTAKCYNVVDCTGNTVEMAESALIQYAKQYGIANAKVVKKDRTEFISAISGTFEIIGGRLSDDLTSQWDRLQALKIDGKLSQKSVETLDNLEDEFKDKIAKLKKSELRSRLNCAFDIARTYNIIDKLADVMDEVDIERVDKMQKRVSKLFKEVKTLGRVQKKTMSKENRDKFAHAMKVIGKEFRKVIKLVEEEEISSDECIRKFEVISSHLIRLKSSLEK